MEIRQLKAFLAIAEAKTFTAGARRVNVTQAAISMQIRQRRTRPLAYRLGISGICDAAITADIAGPS